MCPLTQAAEGGGLENRKVVMSGAGVRILQWAPFMIYPTIVVRYIDTAGAKLPVMPWHRLKYECASFFVLLAQLDRASSF